MGQACVSWFWVGRPASVPGSPNLGHRIADRKYSQMVDNQFFMEIYDFSLKIGEESWFFIISQGF